MNFCISLEYFYPWKFSKFMALTGCTGMRKKACYFLVWTLGKLYQGLDLKNWQLSFDKEDDKQILAFLEAVNQFQSSLAPGSYITLDESMIKSYHQNLKGKIKIICKPRPIGNKIKNLSDAASNIVLDMGLYVGKDIMTAKDYVKPFGATPQQHFN